MSISKKALEKRIETLEKLLGLIPAKIEKYFLFTGEITYVSEPARVERLDAIEKYLNIEYKKIPATPESYEYVKVKKN